MLHVHWQPPFTDSNLYLDIYNAVYSLSHELDYGQTYEMNWNFWILRMR